MDHEHPSRRVSGSHDGAPLVAFCYGDAMRPVCDVSIQVPLIETKRLRLRCFNSADTDIFVAAIIRDQQTIDVPISQFEAWRTLAMVMGGWLLEGVGYWVIEDKLSCQILGRVGGFAPLGLPVIEVGWEIFPAFRRLGYATEATVGALIWLRHAQGRTEFAHNIVRANVASEALARALGSERIQDSVLAAGERHGTWITRWDRFIRSPAYRAYSDGP